MKILTFIIAFLVMSSALVGEDMPTKTKINPSEIYIIQNNIENKLTTGSITIKKKEFILKFVLHKTPELRINFSGNPHVHNAASKNIDQIYLFPFFSGHSECSVTF